MEPEARDAVETTPTPVPAGQAPLLDPADQTRRSRLVGSLTATAGLGALTGGDASFGGTVRLLAQLHSWVGVGLEMSYHRFGRATMDNAGLTYPVDQDARITALAARLGPSHGRIRPYGLVGYGVYSFDMAAAEFSDFTEFRGGSLGLGIEYELGHGPLAAVLEGRVHTRLESRDPGERDFEDAFLTLTGGLSWHW